MRGIFASIIYCLCAAGVSVSGLAQSPDIREAPVKDRFSGKTVTSKEMGLELLRTRRENAPRPGEKAPPFELIDQETGRKVALSSLHKDKPLVLLFSGYQCDVFQRGWPFFVKVYEKYREDCNFVLIYIREAHSPGSGFSYDQVEYFDPVTDALRKDMAALCRKKMKVPFQILVDEIDDPVSTRWAGWPIRMFVVKTDGTVGYASLNGPWGFTPGGGFVHGDGTAGTRDLNYSQNTLEEYLDDLLKKK